MILATISLVIICIFARKIKRRKVDLYLKIISIVIPILEVVKIVWESYWDITLGAGFNYTGLLPLYTCSIFIFVLPLAAWGKRRIKDYALSWMATLGIFSGLTNFYLTQILYTYPFFTFATFMSLMFHYMMVVTGLIIVISRYKKIDWIDGAKGFVPLALFSVVVIPVDYILKCDYMLYYYGNGAPLLPQLSTYLSNYDLRWLFTLIIFLGYLLISYISVLIFKMTIKNKKKKIY